MTLGLKRIFFFLALKVLESNNSPSDLGRGAQNRMSLCGP